MQPDDPSIDNQARREKINGEWHTFTYGTFGRDEALAPTRFGHKLRREGLTLGQAEAEIWKAALATYPNYRFFARAFATVAEEAFDGKR